MKEAMMLVSWSRASADESLQYYILSLFIAVLLIDLDWFYHWFCESICVGVNSEPNFSLCMIASDYKHT